MFMHALGAEQAHDVVLEREEEARFAGVALTAGTAAELIVDPAGLVALRADDEQAAGRAHARGLLGDLGLVLGKQLLVAARARQGSRDFPSRHRNWPLPSAPPAGPACAGRTAPCIRRCRRA